MASASAIERCRLAELVAGQNPAAWEWLTTVGSNFSVESLQDACWSPGVLAGLTRASPGTNDSPEWFQSSAMGRLPIAYALVWSLLYLVVTLMTSCVFHFCWLHKTAKKEQSFQRRAQLDQLVSDLVVYFAPLLAVDGYEFKGIRGTREGVRLDFQDLGLTLKSGGRCVLQGVTGSFKKGKMVAIMGPSGSGKTTFMNTLCGKATYGNMTGEVKINGKSWSFKDWKSVTGYVPQDDVVHECLTVREQIEFSAKLRNDYRLGREELANIVEDVLHVLQIGHIQGSIVGSVERRGISGGQRKRVNIGLELAACPVLLFLDEPTSGLDSTSSQLIVNMLKKMTDLGMSVIMVIHQPRNSLYTLFDQVLLLGPGGRTVYLGGPEDGVAYFHGLGFQRSEMMNPADWLMDVISGEVANDRLTNFKREHLFDLWLESEAQADRPSAHDSPEARRERRQETVIGQSYDMIKGMIMQEWDTADVYGIGSLTVNELSGLLVRCLDRRPDLLLVRELMLVMGGGRFGSREEELVSKGDFDIFMRARFDAMVQQQPPWGDLRPSSWQAEGGPTQDALEKRLRRGPFRQWVVISHRRMVQFWRDWVRRVADLFLFSVCAAFFAGINSDQVGSPPEVQLCQTGLSLLVGISVLSTFADKAVLQREMSTGVNIVALYVARVGVSLIDAANLTIVYAIVYYTTLSSNDAPFPVVLFPALCLAWAVTAWGFLFSVLVPARNSMLVTLVVVLLLTQVLGRFDKVVDSLQNEGSTGAVTALSPTRWSGPMQFIMSAKERGGVLWAFAEYPPPTCAAIVQQEQLEFNCSAINNETALDRCANAANSEECTLGIYQECVRKQTEAMDVRKAKRLMAWLKNRALTEYSMVAYGVLVNDRSLISDAVILMVQGLCLHLLGFLSLLLQSPWGRRLQEKAPCSLHGFCRRSKPSASEESAAGLDSESSSQQPPQVEAAP